MRLLDQRLLARARAARRLLILDSALGLVGAVLVVVQATLIARIVTRAFDGAPLRAVAVELGVLAVTFAGRGCGAPGGMDSAVRASPRARGETPAHTAGRAGRGGGRRDRRDGCSGRRRARGVLRQVPAPGRARRGRPVRRGRVGCHDRRGLGPAAADHAPACALGHVADRSLHKRAHARALARASPALDPLPRCRTRVADPARLQSQPCAGGCDLGRRRALPTRGDGHPSRQFPFRLGPRARGHAWCCAGRRDGRRQARRWRHRAAGRADGADPRARAVRAASTARRPVPCERRRRRRCGADAGTARGARLRRPVREAGAV